MITLLLDGVADRSYKELDYKTPLQYAKTPNLDKIARKSQCGLMNVLDEGIALGTDLAHFIMFGYDISEYPNRAIVDALGEDIDIENWDLVLRISFASVVKKNGYFINERFVENLEFSSIDEILDIISFEMDGYYFKAIHSYDSHGFLLIKRKNNGLVQLSDCISDSDPFYSNMYVMKVESFESNEGDYTANLINKYLKLVNLRLEMAEFNKTRKENNLLKVNFILTKWAGSYRKIESFYGRVGMRGVVLAKSNLFKGLCKLLSIDFIKYSSFEEAVDMACTLDYDYIHLHIKDTDIASHKKDPFLKVKIIEDIDKKIKKILEYKKLLIVTADHATPCSGKMIHSGESVPFMACGKYIRIENVSRFNEIDVINGSLRLKGKDFINYIHSANDMGTLYHLRNGKKRRNYINKNINKLM